MRTKVTGIYKITSPYKKVYIGQTRDFRSRQYQYNSLNCRGQQHLYHSLSKHGPKKHLIEIIHELPIDVSQEVLNAYEQLYLDQYRDLGFKMMNIKEAGSNGKLAQSTKDTISKKRKAYYKANPEKAVASYKKISDANKKWREENPDAVKENISAMRNWLDDPSKKKEIYARSGQKTKARFKENPNQHKELYEKSVAARKGKPLSEEHRAKISAYMKGTVKSPEHQAKINAAIKGKKKNLTDEQRKALSERGKNNVGKNGKSVCQYSLDGQYIKTWPSLGLIQKETGISRRSIANCCIGLGKTAGGFKWEFTA